MTPRTAGCAILALLAACATPRTPEIRELARIEYVVESGGETRPAERLLLSTTRHWGREFVITSYLQQVAEPVELRLRTGPDWSPLDATMAGSHGDPSVWIYTGAPGAPEWFFDSHISFLIAWLRRHPLAPGEKLETRVIRPGAGRDDLSTHDLEFERLADRGRALCYRYRLDRGPWRLVQTDHRDVPLQFEFDGVVIRGRELAAGQSFSGGELK
jgi:hypothetical protein